MCTVKLASLLILLACLGASLATYGTHPFWASYSWGLDLIVLASAWQWALVGFAVLMCLGLTILVARGDVRLVWLIGLGPVLGLLFLGFAPGGDKPLVIDSPSFLAAGEASFVSDDDWVVGLVFAGKAYAFPYANLHRSPVVIVRDHDRWMVLLFSAPANRARAMTLSGPLAARDLRIVSLPAGALLLYDRPSRQFVNALKVRTLAGEMPRRIAAELPVDKLPLGLWRAQHPDALVMLPAGPLGSDAPRGPVAPRFPLPASVDLQAVDPLTRVALVGAGDPPLLMDEARIAAEPINLTHAGVPTVVFRRRSGEIIAFDRRLEGDLIPTFLPAPNRSATAALFERDTRSTWDETGLAVNGPMKGQRLKPVAVETGLYWGVMKYWYPQAVRRAP